MKFIKCNEINKNVFKLKDESPIVVKDREDGTVHCDTDSNYFCFDETMKKIFFENEDKILDGISQKEIRITLTVLNTMLKNIKKQGAR